MRVVVFGVGVPESRMCWERGEATETARQAAESLSVSWSEAGESRWAIEVPCQDGDEVLRLVSETAGDRSVQGLAPASRH
jgi:hypothetical protein